MKISPKVPKRVRDQADTFAKLIALHCVRNTFIEDLHSGIVPRSQTGDFSDVKVVTPFGEIPWNEVSRLSDIEMKRFNMEVVNKIFTFLIHIQNEHPPIGANGFYLPTDWAPGEIDAGIENFFTKAKRVTTSENIP